MPRMLVSHEVRHNANGDATGLAFRKHVGRGTVHEIVHFYIHKEDGHDVARISTGDTWKCKQVNHPDYEYVTVQ